MSPAKDRDGPQARAANFPMPGRLAALADRPMAARFLLLAVMSLLAGLPYAVPPLLDWLAGRGAGATISLERSVENMSFHLFTAGFMALALGLGMVAWRTPRRLAANGATSLVLLLAAAGLLSALLNAGWDFNPRTLLLPAASLVAYLAVLLAGPAPRQVSACLALLPAVAVPVSLYALAQSQGYEMLNYGQVWAGTDDEVAGKMVVASTFGHPNYLSSFLAPVLPFAVMLAVAPGGKIRRALGAAAVVAIAGGMFAAGTRGAWLATIVGAVPFYLIATLSPAYRRPLLFTGGLILVTLVLALVIPNPFLRVRYDVLDRLLASKEIVTRFYYWIIAFHLWAQGPWFGIGFGNYNVLFWPAVAEFQTLPGSEYYQFVLEEMVRGVPPGFAHNDHIQILTEHGIVGLGLWLGLWSLTAVQIWETARQKRGDLRGLLVVAAFAAAFTAFLTDGLTNFPAHIPASALLIAVLLGLWHVWLAWQRNCWISLETPPPPRREVDSLVPELPRIRKGRISGTARLRQ